MKLFLDTNVVIDVIAAREPFVADSRAVFNLCETGKADGCISALTLCTVSYVLRKFVTPGTMRTKLRAFRNVLTPVDLTVSLLDKAISSPMTDFEDAVQFYTAVYSEALYKDYNPDFGGRYKDSVNYIQESLPDGTFKTIFISSKPEEVVMLLDNLIYQFNMCAADEECNKLILIAVFMLDFMCIHPYNHGNGRLSRLILHFLLKKYGYDIDDYFAIAYLMKQHLGEYIDAFKQSSANWHKSENDYEPYVSFVLKRILEAYRKLDYMLEVNSMKGTAEEKVLKVVVDSATPISKTVVLRVLYALSKVTVEKALSKLVDEGRVQLITKGRYSKYFRV